MKELILGIDPGLTGGVGVMYPGEFITAFSTPIIKGTKGSKTQYNMVEMVNLLESFKSDRAIPKAYIESVHSMPGQGVSSSFSFGIGFGSWLAILAALRISHELVTPQRWQKALFKDLPGKDPKQKGELYMSQHFPEIKIKKCLIDAFLIAYWGSLNSNQRK